MWIQVWAWCEWDSYLQCSSVASAANVALLINGFVLNVRGYNCGEMKLEYDICDVRAGGGE